MAFRSVTYTSVARPDLQTCDLEAIHETAQRENAARDITGLLIFNGTHFLQILEGRSEQLAQLIENLRRDVRHTRVEVRHDDPMEERSFPGWSMELVKVSASPLLATEMVSDRLPRGITAVVKNRVMRMTEHISTTSAF